MKRLLLRACCLGMMFALVLVAVIVADDKGIAVTRQNERVAGAISNADQNRPQAAPVGVTGTPRQRPTPHPRPRPR
jgi:hypothetical protein